MNGELATQIREMLERKDEISTDAAVQFMLTMQVQTYDKIAGISKAVEDQEKRLGAVETKVSTLAPEAEVKEVKEASIILWIKKHPNWALSLVALILALDPRDLILQALHMLGVIKLNVLP